MTYKLPEGWREVKLGEVVEYETGKLNSNASVENGKYPFFTCAPEPLRINDYKYDKEAILLAGNNAGGIFHVNRYCGKFNAYQRTYIMETKNKDVLCNDFLYYLLNINLNHFKNISSGSATKFLTRKILDKINLRLPPLQEQKAISSTLSALDDKIELNSKINKNLEDQAHTIFKHWFIDFEFPDENGNPYKSSGGEMVESELGMIPKGWEVIKLKDIAKDIVLGKTPRTSIKEYFGGEVPFLTIPDMHNKVYVDNTERTLSDLGVNSQPHKTVPKNSVCVSCIATPGLVTITKEPTQTNQQINTIIPRIEYTYVYSFMKSISNKIISLGSGGTTTNNLNKTEFSNIDILLPPKEIRSRYDKIAESLFVGVKGNQHQNQTLSQLRDTLLPKLMSGEVRIPLDE